MYPVLIPVTYSRLGLSLIPGIVLGTAWAAGGGAGGSRVALILLSALVVLMTRLGSSIYGEARQLTGQSYRVGGKPQPPVEAASAEVFNAALNRGNPTLLIVISFGGVVIAWLMMFKPF